MSGWGARMLPFVAVGRVKDSVTLAYHLAPSSDKEQMDKTKQIFSKLLAAASMKLNPGQRTRLQWNDGSVCCLMSSDGRLLYSVITSELSYPENSAYALLHDLKAKVEKVDADTAKLEVAEENGLNEELEPEMRELVRQYEEVRRSSKASQRHSTDPSASSSLNFNSFMVSGRGGGGSRLPLIIGVVLVVLLIVAVAAFFVLRNMGSVVEEAVPAHMTMQGNLAMHDSMASSAVSSMSATASGNLRAALTKTFKTSV